MEAPPQPDCPFCRIIVGVDPAEPVYSDDQILATNAGRHISHEFPHLHLHLASGALE